MTKKDYIAFAFALRAARNLGEQYGDRQEYFNAGFEAAERAIIATFRADNARFDYDRFIAACRGDTTPNAMTGTDH